MRYLLIGMFLLTSCVEDKYPESSYKNFKLENGRIVRCIDNVARKNCGMTFYNCKDGNKYYCQTNVTEVP